MLNSLGNLSTSIANYEEVHLSVLKGSFYEENKEWDLLGYKYESDTVYGHLKRTYSLVQVNFLLEPPECEISASARDLLALLTN